MSREVPEGWRGIKLGELTHIIGGTTPSKAEPNYWDGGDICWATPTDITSLDTGQYELEKTKSYVTKLGVSKSSLQIIPVGSVLMTSRATIGYAAINSVPMTTNQGFSVFLPNDQFDCRFLLQWIIWKRAELLNVAGGSTFPEISKTTLRSLEIDLPPFHEQRRIAEILSSVDDFIAATQAMIEQTKKVKQATLERLLTKGIGHRHFKQTEVGDIPDSWDVATIESYLARLIDYRGVPPPKAETGIPLITAKNVRMGYLNPEPREYIREADFNDWMRRGIPEAGDVLFTTEAPLGYVAQVPNYQIALGQRTITLCPDRKRLNPSFLTWLLLSSASQLRIMERATGSTALGIKQATFRKILFPFPPLDEQRKIAFYMDEIAKTEELENRKLTGLIAIKSALMSDLLTGRKRVTDTQPLAAE